MVLRQGVYLPPFGELADPRAIAEQRGTLDGFEVTLAVPPERDGERAAYERPAPPGGCASSPKSLPAKKLSRWRGAGPPAKGRRGGAYFSAVSAAASTGTASSRCHGRAPPDFRKSSIAEDNSAASARW